MAFENFYPSNKLFLSKSNHHFSPDITLHESESADSQINIFLV